MCSPAQCSTCGRPTYVGCGNHVEQVLGHVPADERCKCGDSPRTAVRRPFFSGRRRSR